MYLCSSAWLRWLTSMGMNQPLRASFESVLKRVEAAFESSGGPYFFGSEFSIVDIQFAPFLERMAASLLYYKAFNMRNNPSFPRLEQWFKVHLVNLELLRLDGEVTPLAKSWCINWWCPHLQTALLFLSKLKLFHSTFNHPYRPWNSVRASETSNLITTPMCMTSLLKSATATPILRLPPSPLRSTVPLGAGSWRLWPALALNPSYLMTNKGKCLFLIKTRYPPPLFFTRNH